MEPYSERNKSKLMSDIVYTLPDITKVIWWSTMPLHAQPATPPPNIPRDCIFKIISQKGDTV